MVRAASIREGAGVRQTGSSRTKKDSGTRERERLLGPHPLADCNDSRRLAGARPQAFDLYVVPVGWADEVRQLAFEFLLDPAGWRSTVHDESKSDR